MKKPNWKQWRLRLLIVPLVALLLLLIMMISPLSRWLPRSLDVTHRAEIMEYALRIDSLEHESRLRAAYLDNMLTILSDKSTPVDSLHSYDSTVTRITDTLGVATGRELDFADRYEQQERFGLAALDEGQKLQGVLMISPVKGEVLLPESEVDLAPGTPLRVLVPKEVPVLAPSDAVVISQHLLVGEGWELVMQAAGENLIILSHLTMSLVDVGQTVKAGRAIGHAGAQMDKRDRWLGIQVWRHGKETDPQSVMTF